MFPLFRTVSVRRINDTRPLLYFTKSILAQGPAVPLSGKVWISVSAFDPSKSGYFGLSVKNGTVTFEPGTNVSVGQIVTDETFELVVNLSTTENVATPGRATFTFLPDALSFDAQEAYVAYLGHTFELNYTQDQPVYDGAKVHFPFAHDPEKFSLDKSGLASFSGNASIISSSWSFPVTNDVTGTTGVGGLFLLFTEGLKVSWPGNDTLADVGACSLLAEPDKITFRSANTQAYSSQRTALGNDSWAQMRFVKPFEMVYVKSDNETLVLSASIEANVSKPITVNGDRVSFVADVGTVTFTRSGSDIRLLVDATAPIRSLVVQSFSIKNCVFKTGNALRWKMSGNFSAGNVTTGESEMYFNLSLLLPILPDPYAAKVTSPVGSTNSTISTTVKWDNNVETVVDVNVQGVPGLLQDNLLMDLSTNSSLFGVLFSPTQALSPIEYGITDLSLGMNIVCLVTPPLVQWESIKVDNSADIQFDDCGGPSYLFAESTTTTPISPKHMISALVQASHVEINFTLPFGMIAMADIPLNKPLMLGTLRSYVGSVSPGFTSLGLTGSDQITVRPPPFGSAPTIPGYAEQTIVFDPAYTTFNSRFGEKSSEKGIPLKRIDISGFGESTFSDWRDDVHPPPTISKALFNVAVGRASQEVIQAYLIQYIEGVRMVHTLKIERSNDGVVSLQTKDSWKAVSDGRYDFKGSNIVVRSGIVRGIVNVRNIIETGRTYPIDGINLIEVMFDCEVDIENVESGSNLVSSIGYKGFVQLDAKSPGQLLTPEQLADLIQTKGEFGGKVDCIVNVGGLRCRISRIGVGVSNGASGPEFVVAAYGSPLFPKGIQWSTLVRTSNDFKSVDTVPIIRTEVPYLFADPNGRSSSDYCIMCATGTQRIAFSQFEINNNTIKGKTGYIADPYALGNSVGVFPTRDMCIPFFDYSMDIDPSGNIKLNLPEFITGDIKRIMYEGDVSSSYAYCSGDTRVTVVIDTASSVPASLGITNIALAFESGNLKEVLRTIGDLKASSAEPTKFDNARTVYGPSLQDSIEKVPVIHYFKDVMPPPQVTTSNSEFNIKVSALLDLDGLNKKTPGLPTFIKEFVKNFVVDLSIGTKAKLSKTETAISHEFRATIKFPTPWSTLTPDGLQGVVGIAMLSAQFRASSSDKLITIGLGVGLGYVTEFAGFKVVGYFAVSFAISPEIGNIYGYAGSIIMKGKVDLKVVDIEVSIEAKREIFIVRCALPGAPPTAALDKKTSWGVSQVAVAIEVSIFAILDIELDFEFEWIQKTEDGPCLLPPEFT